MSQFTDRVLIVTGAAGGIGAATVREALSRGARVVLFDRDADGIGALAETLGDRTLASAGDVTVFADQERAVNSAVSHFGRLDAMVANAGMEGVVAPLISQTQEDFERVLRVNVLGVFNSIRAAAPAMKAGGSIVVTSSIAGFIGSPGLGPYVSSKHAVVGLMRTAALELAASGIRVNSVHPGPVDNRMMRSIEEQASPGHAADVRSGFTSQVPMGRYATNEDIAKLILFLCSEESAYCTGQRFVSDGGFLAQ